MDWKLIAATFGLVFVSELGDKTQLAALALTGKSGRPWSVFLGASVALVVATAIGVGAGALLKKALPEKAVSIVSALLFIGVGVFLLVKTVFFGGEGE